MDSDKPLELMARTKAYALQAVRLYASLPKKAVDAQFLGSRVLWSATFVASEYREAQRASSHADFKRTLLRSLDDLYETAFWLELLADACIVPSRKLAALRRETDELTAILVTMAKKVKKRNSSG
jgi:four helix bundle protein